MKTAAREVVVEEEAHIQSTAYYSNKESQNWYLHGEFERIASRTPDAVALECGNRVLTYSEVDKLANRLSHKLRENGVEQGSFVGISMERSEWPIIAIIAVLKAGGAYIPIEPSLPDARISYIAEMASLDVIITDQKNIDRIQSLWDGTIVTTCQFQNEMLSYPSAKLFQNGAELRPNDVCYILFTSGTTGRPKGVVTEHSNAVHFVRAFNSVCDTTSQDRIFQGFALGFDGSVEEMWMAFTNGATLVCGDSSTPRFGEDLGQFLDEKQITFFSTVPTLLATLPNGLPHLRQLVVSGEACPPDLVKQWATPGRTMLNVYGPTEATVNTTASVLKPNEPVTIGRPLPGYTTYILNDNLEPTNEGELFISGPTICRGYLNETEQTERAFLNWTPPNKSATKVRLYRTGDLVRMNNNHELEFLGRIDTQIKIRGFRVELSEIDAILVEHEEVSAAATTVHQVDGHQTLASYISLADGHTEIDRAKILASLRDRLPIYMLPTFLEVLNEFPRLSSGKIDRKQLPPPKSALVEAQVAANDPMAPDEKRIADVWAKHLNVSGVSATQNFFTELGGHSLLAARVAGELHGVLGQQVPVRDIYANPTVRELAAILGQRRSAEEADAPRRENLAQTAVRPNRPWYIVAIQSLYFLLIVPILALPAIYIVPLGLDALRNGQSIPQLVLLTLSLAVGMWMLLILLAIGAKWLLIGKYKPGRHPIWGSYYIRWWITSRLQHLSNIAALNGTPFAPIIWRAMGAKVGRYCTLNASLVYAWDCISLGDHVSIGHDTHMAALRIEDGNLVIGSIEIGDRCFVGNHSALGLNVRMAADGKLDDQSTLPDGMSTAPAASLSGSPPQERTVHVPQGIPQCPTTIAQFLFGTIQLGLGTLVVLLLVAPIAILFSGTVSLFLHASTALATVAFIAMVPTSLIVFAFWTAAIKKLVQPQPKAGLFKRHSATYLRYWLAELVMHTVKTVGISVFTTLYLPPWMRLLGARLGKNTEMSTVWRINPDMLDAGDGVFFADGCIIGEGKSHLGWIEVRKVSIGHRSFVGNSAVLSAGDELGNDCLLGVLSTTPNSRERTADQTDWLGSPGFQLPNRQKGACFGQEETFEPSRKLYVQRALIDALRAILPGYIYGGLAIASIFIVLHVHDLYGNWGAYTAITLLPWLALIVCVGSVVSIKWTIMGAFKPVVVPLWNSYVWWNEFVNGMYEALMGPWVSNFYGTPFAPMLLRLLGCKIGKSCYIETNLFSEFDLIEIGDHVALNAGVIVQNHLFEDRIMKSSTLKLSHGCTVGNMGVVLYDATIEENAVLGPLSLLMKGETMPRNERWHGIPTVNT